MTEAEEFEAWKKAKQEADEKLEFTLVRAEKSVTLNKPDGSKWPLILRELDGTSRDKFIDMMTKRVSKDRNGTATLSNAIGIEQKLISMSLFDSATNKYIEEKTIADWPGGVQAALFKAAQRLSGLDKETSEADAKNA